MATTINAANVSIGYDGSKLKAGVDGSRSELSRLSRTINESIDPMIKQRREIELLTKLYQAGGINAHGYANALEHLRKKHLEVNAASAAGKGADGSGGGGLGMLAMLGRFAIPVGVGAGIVSIGKSSLTLAANVEQASAAFEVLTGSAQTAANMVASMKKMDAESPLNFLDIQQAGKTMLGYGITAEQVMPSLRQLGDISMGNADRFNRLSLAFGQVAAAGRLTGQDVLQMVNAGFNPLATIADKMAKEMGGLSSDYMPRLKKSMEAGEVSFKMVQEAIAAATSEGGRFAGMSERMANTGAGAYAKLISSMQSAGTALGKELMPIGTVIAKGLTTGFEGIAWTLNGGYRDYAKNVKAASDEASAALKKTAEEAAAATKQQAAALLEEKRAAIQARREAWLEETKSDRERLTSKVSELLAENRLLKGQETELDQSKQSLWGGFSIGNMSTVDKQNLADAERLLAENSRLKEQKKIDEDYQKQKEKEAEDVRQFAEKYATANEKLNTTFSSIAKLETLGLSGSIADKARREAIKQQMQEQDQGLSATIAPALKAGSAEAYKYLIGQKEDAAKKAQEKAMLKAQTEQVKLQERIAKGVEKMQPMGFIR